MHIISILLPTVTLGALLNWQDGVTAVCRLLALTIPCLPFHDHHSPIGTTAHHIITSLQRGDKVSDSNVNVLIKAVTAQITDSTTGRRVSMASVYSIVWDSLEKTLSAEKLTKSNMMMINQSGWTELRMIFPKWTTIPPLLSMSTASLPQLLTVYQPEDTDYYVKTVLPVSNQQYHLHALLMDCNSRQLVPAMVNHDDTVTLYIDNQPAKQPIDFINNSRQNRPFLLVYKLQKIKPKQNANPVMIRALPPLGVHEPLRLPLMALAMAFDDLPNSDNPLVQVLNGMRKRQDVQIDTLFSTLSHTDIHTLELLLQSLPQDYTADKVSTFTQHTASECALCSTNSANTTTTSMIFTVPLPLQLEQTSLGYILQSNLFCTTKFSTSEKCVECGNVNTSHMHSTTSTCRLGRYLILAFPLDSCRYARLEQSVSVGGVNYEKLVAVIDEQRYTSCAHLQMGTGKWVRVESSGDMQLTNFDAMQSVDKNGLMNRFLIYRQY